MFPFTFNDTRNRDHYELLESNTQPKSIWSWVNRPTTRYLRTNRLVRLLLRLTAIAAVAVFGLLSLNVLSAAAHTFGVDSLGIGPPSYSQLKKWQRNLPQHNLDLPFPEGRTGRYVKFSNQVENLGWNNVFNDILISAHVAHESNRGYVFHDYVWNPDHYPWQRQWPFDQVIPTTPLPALIGGPVTGGSWSPGDSAPRSIHESYFDIVCPKRERTYINAGEVKRQRGDSNAEEIVELWITLLQEAPERCIEVVPEGNAIDHQILDMWVFASDRVLSVWSKFSKSAVSRLLTASPIAAAAVKNNQHLLLPKGLQSSEPTPENTWDRTLSIHLRRGDYVGHCWWLATLSSTYYSWNLLDSLPDRFLTGPVIGEDIWNDGGRREDYYVSHCLPEVDALVQRARHARDDYIRQGHHKGEDRTVDVLYLLTNEKGEFLDELLEAFRKDGWENIRATRDLELNREAIDVSMAVDMEIARQAAVFIGNGFSSFTSNVVHQRLVSGKEPISIRFF